MNFASPLARGFLTYTAEWVSGPAWCGGNPEAALVNLQGKKRERSGRQQTARDTRVLAR